MYNLPYEVVESMPISHQLLYTKRLDSPPAGPGCPASLCPHRTNLSSVPLRSDEPGRPSFLLETLTDIFNRAIDTNIESRPVLKRGADYNTAKLRQSELVPEQQEQLFRAELLSVCLAKW